MLCLNTALLRQYMSVIRYRHLLICFHLTSIILWSFVLAGCTSTNGLKSVYLFRLSYSHDSVTSPPDPLVSGFFALCVAFNAGVWVCGSDAKGLVASISLGDNSDPLNIIRLAEKTRTGLLFPGLIIIVLIFAVITICFLFALPGWRRDDGSGSSIKPLPSLKVLYIMVLISSVATLFGLASAFWQHIGSAGASTMTRLLTYGMVKTEVGATCMVFSWIAAVLSGVVTLGICVLVLSVRVLMAAAEEIDLSFMA
ncbi:Ca2+ regulator and membrane fusion protein Fig1-domain-containing protein [Xylariaceae sp. FL1272]|nr:Ca2+ regulator and membrane fusion protein Fig1-domain-containing protein [Xylariaceae sp. FL1272]